MLKVLMVFGVVPLQHVEGMRCQCDLIPVVNITAFHLLGCTAYLGQSYKSHQPHYRTILIHCLSITRGLPQKFRTVASSFVPGPRDATCGMSQLSHAILAEPRSSCVLFTGMARLKLGTLLVLTPYSYQEETV